MKTLTISLFLVVAILTARAQYHIQVRCFGGQADEAYQSYAIYFTNNNWKSEFPIRCSFDISDAGDPIDVNCIELLFINMNTSRQDAINFAKRFKTYANCVNWNKKELDKYHALLTYRKAHPIIIKVKGLTAKKGCCKITQIY